ncbi:MAG: energy transducer TonB [Pseudomonadota bacterium]
MYANPDLTASPSFRARAAAFITLCAVVLLHWLALSALQWFKPASPELNVSAPVLIRFELSAPAAQPAQAAPAVADLVRHLVPTSAGRVAPSAVSQTLPSAPLAQAAVDSANEATGKADGDSRPVASIAPQSESLQLPKFDVAYLRNPPPAYPAFARRLGEEGKVILHVLVTALGSPSQIEIQSSSGSLRLDQAAKEAVWQWKFVPAHQGERALDAWVKVPIVFNLRG